MHNEGISRAIFSAVQFLELSDDTVVDPGDAVRAMESIAGELSRSTPPEREALRAALRELIRSANGADASPAGHARIQFYKDFMESFGTEKTAAQAGE
jgi:hypothetical protein